MKHAFPRIVTYDGIRQWTEGFKIRENLPIRETSMDFLHLHGIDIEGSVLNCGSAYDRYNYHRFFPICSRYRLLDLEPIENWYGREPREVLLADVQDMPHVPSNSEDCLIAYWFIDYRYLDQTRIFSEFNRILKPDGILLASFNAGAFSNKRYGHFTLNDITELVRDFFTFEDVAYHCENGKQLLILIKARVNKFARAPRDFPPLQKLGLQIRHPSKGQQTGPCLINSISP